MKAFSGDGLTDTGSLFFDPDLSRLTTGRTTSLFAEDIKARDADLRSAFTGRRILVTGGAGSIGSATLELMPLHSCATSMVTPGTAKMNPWRSTGTPTALKSK